MKEALTMPELKALCEFFHDSGKAGDDFESTFNDLLQGKYNKSIGQTGFKKQWQEMESEIQKHMDEWDEGARKRAAQASIDIRSIIFYQQ